MNTTETKPGASIGPFLAYRAFLRNAITEIRLAGLSTELAIAVHSPSGVDEVAPLARRIYVGWEFCPKLFPTVNRLRAIATAAAGNRMALTLATPFLPPGDFNRIAAATESLAKFWKKRTHERLEVVVNDLGLLVHLQMGRLVDLTAGRLLVKQRRDPRVAAAWTNLPAELRHHLQHSSLGFTPFNLVLRQLGVTRAELDNLSMGIAVPAAGLPVSLHAPFGYLAAGRRCAWAEAIRGSPRDYATSCGSPCRGRAIRLVATALATSTVAYGNVLFFYNEKIRGNLRALAPERLVVMPRLP